MSKYNKIFYSAFAAVMIFGLASLAFASTSNYSHTFTLTPGDHCVQTSNEVNGSDLQVNISVSDGECDGQGETITVAPEPTPTPSETVEVPEQCAGMTFNGVTIVSNTYGDHLVGTNKRDLLIAKAGGSLVEGLDGNDCISIVNNSAGYGGNGERDRIIHTGNAGLADGGPGERDYCEVGPQSGKVNCERPR